MFEQYLERLKRNDPTFKSVTLTDINRGQLVAFSQALKDNTTLISLTISDSRHYGGLADAVLELIEALKSNSTLVSLNFTKGSSKLPHWQNIRDAVQSPNSNILYLNVTSDEKDLDELTTDILKKRTDSVDRLVQIWNSYKKAGTNINTELVSELRKYSAAMRSKLSENGLADSFDKDLTKLEEQIKFNRSIVMAFQYTAAAAVLSFVAYFLSSNIRPHLSSTLMTHGTTFDIGICVLSVAAVAYKYCNAQDLTIPPASQSTNRP